MSQSNSGENKIIFKPIKVIEGKISELEEQVNNLPEGNNITVEQLTGVFNNIKDVFEVFRNGLKDSLGVNIPDSLNIRLVNVSELENLSYANMIHNIYVFLLSLSAGGFVGVYINLSTTSDNDPEMLKTASFASNTCIIISFVLLILLIINQFQIRKIKKRIGIKE